MAERGLIPSLKLGNYPLRQYLAQLYSPLIERIDVPDRALGENGVFIESNQLAQRRRGQLLHQNSVGGPVSLKCAMGNQPIGGAFCLYLLARLAEGESFCLGKDIGDQHVMVSSEGIQRAAESDEVSRDEFGALMN